MRRSHRAAIWRLSTTGDDNVQDRAAVPSGRELIGFEVDFEAEVVSPFEDASFIIRGVGGAGGQGTPHAVTDSQSARGNPAPSGRFEPGDSKFRRRKRTAR